MLLYHTRDDPNLLIIQTAENETSAKSCGQLVFSVFELLQLCRGRSYFSGLFKSPFVIQESKF